MSTSKPWWDLGRLRAQIGLQRGGLLDLARAILVQQAAAEGPTVYEVEHAGAPTEEVGEAASQLEKLGFRLSHYVEPLQTVGDGAEAESADEDEYEDEDELCQISATLCHAHGVVRIVTRPNHVVFTAVFTDPKLAEVVKRHVRTWIQPKQTKGSIYALVSEEQARVRHIGFTKTSFVRDNYSPAVQKAYDTCVRELASPTPKGRIVILDGPPGTGKTFFVRGLITALPTAVFVVIPPHLLSDLAGPTLLPALLSCMQHHPSGTPLVLVLEDADEALLPRQTDNIRLLTTLLQFGDGIFGEVLNLRIITTTNAKLEAIDPALLRAQRLLARVHLDALKPTQASEVAARLAGRPVEITNATTLADLYADYHNPTEEPQS